MPHATSELCTKPTVLVTAATGDGKGEKVVVQERGVEIAEALKMDRKACARHGQTQTNGEGEAGPSPS